MANAIVPENINLLKINWEIENTVISAEKFKKNPVYDFKVSYNMMHNLKQEVVKISIFIDMNGVIEDKAINQGGNYQSDFIFKIKDLQAHYQEINEKMVFDGAFVGTLLSISYSTMRGMLLSLWKGTVLEDVILPVISINDLLKNRAK